MSTGAEPEENAATVVLRPATEADVELIHSLIVALAEYEQAPEQVVGTTRDVAPVAVRTATGCRDGHR